MEKNTIPNGNCQTRTGYKTVHFNDSLEIMPVVYRTYSGYKNGRTTFQLIGSIVIENRWDSRSDENITLTVPAQKENEKWNILNELYARHEWLAEWLEREGRGECYLPEYVAPERNDLSVVNKRKSLEFFESKFGLKLDPLRETINSPKEGLQLKPIAVTPEVLAIIPDQNFTDSSMVDINQFEEWYLSPGTGKQAVKLVIQPHSIYFSNYAHSQNNELQGKPISESLPENAKGFLIRIQHDAYVRNQQSYGEKISVWRL